MIRIEQPALALHSHDVPGYKYKMEYTVKLPKDAKIVNIVTTILLHTKIASGNFLKNVVINCHGSPGHLHIGEGNTINSHNVGLMKMLRIGGQKIGTIWIVACEAAGYPKSIVQIGAYFCAEMARAAGCYVVASNQLQYVNPGFYLRFCPPNCIDNYEGMVYRWDAIGNQETFKP
jgi:hypothetical protein